MADTKLYCGIWNGAVFVPYRRHKRELESEFTKGERVYLEVQHERNMSSHRHQFAYINQAFDSLPERYHNQPWSVNADTMRKQALIETGYCDVSTVDAGSRAAAERIAAWVAAEDIKNGRYSDVTTRGPAVVVRRAVSQSMAKMGAKDFKESKEAVLNWIAALIEVDPEELRKQGDG